MDDGLGGRGGSAAATRPAEPEPVPIRRRPWWTRLSAAQVFVVVAGVLAFLANLVVLRGSDDPTLVAVAARDLAAGERITADDVSLEPVDAEDSILGSFVTDPDWLEGRVVAVPVPESSPIVAGMLRSVAAPDGLRALSLPVPRERAVGGGLEVGDRVDVISVTDGVSRYVAAGVEVLAVPAEQTGLAGAGTHFVVVAVDADQALALTAAVAAGGIDLVRSTGADPAGLVEADPVGGS